VPRESGPKGRKEKEMLTDKQQKILDYIEAFTKENDASPTLTEIQKHFGFSAIGTVQYYVNELVNKGYLSKQTGKWNSLEVVKETNKVPLLGKVAAGRPIEYLKYNEKLEVPPSMLFGKGQYFALQVSGDSMINEGILDGDYVIIKKQDHADAKQIVVAQVNHEATIKKYIPKKNSVELHSANEKYKPIVVDAEQEFNIEGIYCGLIRIVN